MKATANVLLANVTPECKLEHKGEVITFSISVFGRSNFQEEHDVFEFINKYWEYLPEQKQQKIFDTYKEIEYCFDNTHNKSELFEELSNKVADLMILHDLDQVQNWVAIKSDIRIPDTIAADFSYSIDDNTSREKTYTRSDYMKLVTLSVVLRTMVPIWGEYISSIRQDTGTEFKEHYSFQLLNKSNIIHSLPIEKLKIYIEHIVGDDKLDPGKVLNGISSEDLGFWLLALVCIRRLSIGDVRGNNPDSHLMTLIYKYIMQKIKSNDSDFENKVREIEFKGNGGEGEDKISSLERYKIKTDVSLGEIVELEYVMSDMNKIAHSLTYKIDPAILSKSMITCQELMNHRLLDPQINILRWLFKSVISSKGIKYLPKQQIVNALGVAEAVLWARGHRYLAMLVTSYAVMSDKEMIISPIDSKMRVPKEMSDELDRYYPYTKVSNSKKNGPKIVNQAARSIDTLTDNLTMFSWRATADDSLLLAVNGSSSKKLILKPDIKLDLTKLVIELGSREWS